MARAARLGVVERLLSRVKDKLSHGGHLASYVAAAVCERGEKMNSASLTAVLCSPFRVVHFNEVLSGTQKS